MVPLFVISNIIPELTVSVSPEFIVITPFIWHVFGGIQVPPIASHEAWLEIVPPTANESWLNENPINPRIKILTMTDTTQMPFNAHSITVWNYLRVINKYEFN